MTREQSVSLLSLPRLETAPVSFVCLCRRDGSERIWKHFNLFFVRLTESDSDRPQRAGSFQVYHKACEQRNASCRPPRGCYR